MSEAKPNLTLVSGQTRVRIRGFDTLTARVKQIDGLVNALSVAQANVGLNEDILCNALWGISQLSEEAMAAIEDTHTDD